MTDYRQLMRLVLDKVPYREIAAREGCSQRTIAKVRRVLDNHQLTAVSQVDALSREDLDGLFSDGRKSVTGEFVPVDIDKVAHRKRECRAGSECARIERRPRKRIQGV